MHQLSYDLDMVYEPHTYEYYDVLGSLADCVNTFPKIVVSA